LHLLLHRKPPDRGVARGSGSNSVTLLAWYRPDSRVLVRASGYV
jgi:hypothetical protein